LFFIRLNLDIPGMHVNNFSFISSHVCLGLLFYEVGCLPNCFSGYQWGSNATFCFGCYIWNFEGYFCWSYPFSLL